MLRRGEKRPELKMVHSSKTMQLLGTTLDMRGGTMVSISGSARGMSAENCATCGWQKVRGPSVSTLLASIIVPYQ
jgi:hypothetical protein